MTTQDIINYYANLLVLQYLGQPDAYATIQTVVTGPVMDQLPTQVLNAYNLNPTIQTIEFSDVAASGAFTFLYAGTPSASIPWNSPLQTIQDAANSIFGVNFVTVTGSIPSEALTFTFNVNQAPSLITIGTNTLKNGASVAITLSVVNNIAVGVQLDVLGKYAGVTRSGFGSSGAITLSDADFLRLIQLAIIENMSGSSLYTIDNLLNTYFPGEILVYDYGVTSPMRMSYLIDTSILNQNLVQLFIAEGLLPQPMGVSISVIANPVINEFFGFCDYATATPTMPNTTITNPFNCAVSYTLGNYDEAWPWIDYVEAVVY